MEVRIQQLQDYFQKDYNDFIKSVTSPLVKEKFTEKITEKITEKVTESTESTSKPIPKNAHPLMMNKINKYKKDLEKNNMKKQQKAFVCDGTIDDYEKELGLKPIH